MGLAGAAELPAPACRMVRQGELLMYAMLISPRYLLIGLVAAPVVIMAGYITVLIVPMVVEEVVVAVVRSVVTGS